MRYLFFLIIFLLSNTLMVFSQTKKEQILIQQSQIDSLINVNDKCLYLLDSLLNVNKNNNTIINSLEKKYLTVVNNNSTLTNFNLQFQNKFDSLSKINNNLKYSLDSLFTSIKLTNNGLFFKQYDFFGDFGFTDFKFIDSSYKYDSDKYKLPSGRFISYYNKNWVQSTKEKSIIYSEGNYIDGFKEGIWNYYLCDGRKKFEGYYVNGKKNKKWTFYTYCLEKFEEVHFNDFPFLISVFQDLNNFIDYYSLENYNWDIKAEINFDSDIPDEFVFFKNKLNNIVYKVNLTDSLVYYHNNQLISNKNINFNILYSSLLNDLQFIYYSNSKVKFKIVKSNLSFKKYEYDTLGNLIYVSSYNKNGDGFRSKLDLNGNIIDGSDIEDCFNCDKPCCECPCQ